MAEVLDIGGLSPREALLLRLYMLANSPLNVAPPETQTEELRAFLDSCVDPESGAVNADVAESLLPGKWKEELSEVDSIVQDAAEVQGENGDIASPDTAHVNDDATGDSHEMDAERGDANEEEPNVSAVRSRSETPRMAYIVPPQLPKPEPTYTMSLAELQFNIQRQPLARLLAINQKVVSTEAYKMALMEGRLAVTFGRIEELKRADKWSLRQRQKFLGPPRERSHWDHMLSEARYVRAGINGVRRHKLAICHAISLAVLDYFAEKTREDDTVFQAEEIDADIEKTDGGETNSNIQARGSLVEEKEGDTSVSDIENHSKEGSGEDPEDKADDDEAKAPKSNGSVDGGDAGLEAVPKGIVKGANKCKENHANEQYSLTSRSLPLVISEDMLDTVSREVLKMVPEMQAFNESVTTSEFVNVYGVVPVSKFLSAPDPQSDWRRIVIEEVPDAAPLVEGELEQTGADVSGTITETAVIEKAETAFAPDLRAPAPLAFKQRLENEVKPPKPPSHQYLSSRVGSAWQPVEDQRLLQLAKEFHNNWALIAELLADGIGAGSGVGSHAGAAAGAGAEPGAGAGVYTSNVERRTTWQVFERWMQLSHTEPKELRGRYAEAARHWFEALSKASQAAKKRQAPVVIADDSYLRGHKRLRWASMLEGIRKVKRKREIAPKPNNNGFLLRNRSDAGTSRPGQAPVPSASDLARMKFERDKQIADQYTQSRLVAQARAIQASQQQQRHGSASSGVHHHNASTASVGLPASMARNAAVLQDAQIHAQAQSQAHGQGQTAITSGTSSIPPSIAGLPLPPSVAAAAAARQQRQQAAAATALSQRSPSLSSASPVLGGAPSPAALAARANMPQSRARQLQEQAQAQAQAQAHLRSSTPPSSHLASQQMSRAQTPAQVQAQVQAQAQAHAQAQHSQVKPQRAQSHAQAQAHAHSQAQGQIQGQPPAQRPNRVMPFSRQQLEDLMRQIAQNHPTLTPREVQQLAIQNVRRVMEIQAARQRANAANAANASAAQGGNGAPASTSVTGQQQLGNIMGPGGARSSPSPANMGRAPTPNSSQGTPRGTPGI